MLSIWVHRRGVTQTEDPRHAQVDVRYSRINYLLLHVYQLLVYLLFI